MDKLIGRKKECEELQRCIESDRSELVVVYGRRRVGKTFLIEEFFNQKFDFKYVGAHNMSTRRQLSSFRQTLIEYSSKAIPKLKNWDDAFNALRTFLSNLPTDRKRVVFIDEMPWMDSRRSIFVSALENFWNGWAMSQRNIMLIATGSATSWMKNKIVGNKGGLHGRITCSMHLSPFTLRETEEYLAAHSCEWDRYQLAQAYMVLGGIPFYYSLLDSHLSMAENIDRLFFNQGALLKVEFDDLYTALFDKSELYVEIVRQLCAHEEGLTHKKLSKLLKTKTSSLGRTLKNLEASDIIERWQQYGNKSRGTIYRLTDFFTIFYFKFLAENLSKNENWWSDNINSNFMSDWMGYAFEVICMRHSQQIKAALNLAGKAASFSFWHEIVDDEEGNERKGGQIDMVIDRNDHMVHLCEMKFYQSTFSLKKEYERRLRERTALFRDSTKTRKTIVHTFITTYGVTNARNHSIVHSEVLLDDLFDK
ncbi:MAG: ATP-binding protein [Bacteroidales bacterium]|nr:ATP-binding protein [Bacteroidales bacterium]